jgi:hypothetical protein
MSFQAGVATWLAVHVLVRIPLGARFGINSQALAVAIRLETGASLDDIEVSQSDGGALHFQCKTSASLSSDPNAPLAKTIGQLSRWVADAKSAGGLPDLTRNVALLAVRADAPRTLDDLESACRAFDLGGSWAETFPQRNKAERAALSAFEAIATPAWTGHRGAAPSDADLADMARIFRVARFTMEEGDSDWREASRLLGRHLFGDEAVGEAPLRDLKGIVRDLIGSGAPAERAGLLRALRRRGHHDIRAPGFEDDVATLRTVTKNELARLAVHGLLPLGRGVPIARESDAPLIAAVQAGSVLVVGEPGAGKTGSLVHAATVVAAAGDTVVFLSVDRFPGVAIAADLASELGVKHPLIDILAAVPGTLRKILVIDALDAARGGPAEAVFSGLIEDVRQRLTDEWIVVASIRTFDLRNGRRFRKAFAGTPANSSYAEAELSTVRHFLVPRLTTIDLAAAAAASVELSALLDSAPARLANLLRNIFNLSLAAQLLADGTDPAAFRAIRTQSGLIDAYEDVRLNTTPMQQAAGAAAGVMADKRRLSVRKVAISHAALDAVIRSGVLAESGDLVSFAHHVLFDHVAGRFHLAWDDPEALLAQLAGDTSTALLLAPALRFAVERLWRLDGTGRPRSWGLLAAIFSASSVDPVLANVAVRIAVESIDEVADLAGLLARLTAPPPETGLAPMLGRLARFVAMDVEAARAIERPRAVTWALLAEALMVNGDATLVDPARVLLHLLFDHGDFADNHLLAPFGRAARMLLERAWAPSAPFASTGTNAIRFVGKSFASDPVASRALLDRIMREPHFSRNADREAGWLAEQILPITRVDPSFTVDIYAALYGQSISDDATSWFGGQPSRILPLSSNRRQDYEHCRWRLGTAVGEVLEISPHHGTRAVIDALIGKSIVEGYGDGLEPKHVNVGTATIELRGNDIEFNAWNEKRDRRSRDDDLLSNYTSFLQDCDTATFATSVAAASLEYATATVWARILGVGSDRVVDVGDLLWPMIEHPDFLENSGTLRDAIRFVAAAWPSRTPEARIRFESMALDATRFTDEHARDRWRRSLGRVLALVPEDLLELEEMRALRRVLDKEGLLTPNEALYRSSTSWAEGDSFLHDQLRRAGVELDNGSNRNVLDASDALDAHVRRTSAESPASDLSELWASALSLVALIDGIPDLHDQLDRSSWGHIANAVAVIASSPSYAPGADGLPSIENMLALLVRLSSSRYPEQREVET